MSSDGPTIPAWVYNPRPFIRKVIFGGVIMSVINAFLPVVDAVLMVFRGSEPGGSPSDPVWGFADIIAFVFTTAVGLLTWLLGAYFDIVQIIPRALLGTDPGPLLGLVALAVTVAEIIVTIEVLRRITLAALALVNLDSLVTLVTGEN